MNPLTGVVRIIARTCRVAADWRQRSRAETSAPTVGSTSASMPCFCATAMRSSHCCALAGVDWHGRVADDDPVEPVRMALRQPQRGGAAHRQPGEMRSDRRAHPSARPRRRSADRSCSGRPAPRSCRARADRSAARGTRCPSALACSSHIGRLVASELLKTSQARPPARRSGS